jgi:hypothetical protein
MFVSLEARLDNTLSNVDEAGKRIAEIAASVEEKLAYVETGLNRTTKAIEDIVASAVGVQATLDAFAAFLSGGWSNGLGTLVSVIGLTVIYALLLFGLWERWAGFSRLGAISASMASAFGQSIYFTD